MSRTTPNRGWRGVPLELGFVSIALALNLLVRWYTLDDLDRALDHAHDLLALQERLGLDWEHPVQDAALAVPGLEPFASWFYVWGYFPVVLGAMVWLYVWRPAAYPFLRNTLLASGALGLLVYAFYPTAPPRFTELGYVDTVADGRWDAAARPLGIANELAALPSFHMAWLVAACVVVWGATTSRVVRVGCVVVPVVMAWAVVATGNHWVLDVPAGLLLLAAGLAIATSIERLKDGADPSGPTLHAPGR